MGCKNIDRHQLQPYDPKKVCMVYRFEFAMDDIFVKSQGILFKTGFED